MSTHKISFLNIKKKIILNYPKSATMGFFDKRLSKEFETAVVNEPSVFETQKFYCICLHHAYHIIVFFLVTRHLH